MTFTSSHVDESHFHWLLTLDGDNDEEQKQTYNLCDEDDDDDDGGRSKKKQQEALYLYPCLVTVWAAAQEVCGSE